MLRSACFAIVANLPTCLFRCNKNITPSASHTHRFQSSRKRRFLQANKPSYEASTTRLGQHPTKPVNTLPLQQQHDLHTIPSHPIVYTAYPSQSKHPKASIRLLQASLETLLALFSSRFSLAANSRIHLLSSALIASPQFPTCSDSIASPQAPVCSAPKTIQ